MVCKFSAKVRVLGKGGNTFFIVSAFVFYEFVGCDGLESSGEEMLGVCASVCLTVSYKRFEQCVSNNFAALTFPNSAAAFQSLQYDVSPI